MENQVTNKKKDTDRSERKEEPLDLKMTHARPNTVEGALSSAQLVATAALRGVDLSAAEEEIGGLEAEDSQSRESPHRKTHWKSQSVSETSNEATKNFNQNRELWQRRAASQSQIDPSCTSTRHSQELWELRQKHTPDLVMDLPLVGSSSPKEADKVISEEETGSESNSPGPESPDMTTAAERFAKQNQCTLKKNTKVNLPRNKSNNEILSEKTSSDADNLENILNSEKINQVKSELELVINPAAHQQRLTPKMAVKFAASNNSSNPVPSLKPQVKQKPQILRKPVLPLPVPPSQTPPEIARKDAHD